MASKKEKVEILETEQIQEPIIVDDRNVLLEFWNKYSKKILMFLGGLLLGVLLFFGYKNFVKAPKEKEAAEASFPAEMLFGKMASSQFSKDSVNIVLNGGVLDGAKITGLLSIISKYGGTNAGNRASYFAGATYLHTNEYEKAIKYLKDYDNKGAYQTEIKKQTMLGHCYAELKKNDEALDAYTKATSVNKKDENFTADALMVAGGFAEKIGKNKEAIAFYKEARDEYPNFAAVQNGDVDKYLAKLGVTN
jgi:tetratricopeptide (TPR) repeat protein